MDESPVSNRRTRAVAAALVLLAGGIALAQVGPRRAPLRSTAEAAAAGARNLAIQVTGVTNTQAVLAFVPPSDSTFCAVQVTSVKTPSGWDYSTVVPDTDPALFDFANDANGYDPDASPNSRGTAMPDGARALVIGSRKAEYSPYTYKMHSRALQASTPHQAFIDCGTASGTAEFVTDTILTGQGYSDPIPADPDRPGEYAYPTFSWTSRTEGIVDPQTGLLIRNLGLPSDSILLNSGVPYTGNFGGVVPVYPARGLPAPGVFLPARLWQAIPEWMGFHYASAADGWKIADGLRLGSFVPSTLYLNCLGCNNSPITVCLTADGATCAVDRNVMADPNEAPDPNAKVKGVLGVTFNCSGTCSFPSDDPRWKDLTSYLAAWHPKYSSISRPTVAASFQSDSVAVRTVPVQCDGSVRVIRQLDGNLNPTGPPFNPLWTKGTPLTIGSGRYTVNQVVDENAILLNESCSQGAGTLTADTFGLLVLSPSVITAVVAGPWTLVMNQNTASWDASGSDISSTNCSKQLVNAGAKAGWHCQIGGLLYFVARDGSFSLPMGVAGRIGTGRFCKSAYWDDLDGNTLLCFEPASQAGQTTLYRMTFHGDHAGLERASFTTPYSGSDKTTFLPACVSTSPPSPNNCFDTKILNDTTTGVPILIESSIAGAAKEAWVASPFPKGLALGWINTQIANRLDDSHLILSSWFGQNGLGFLAVLELSQPRGTARVSAVLPSWRAGPNAPAGTSVLRWGGFHGSGGLPWAATKAGFAPTYFRADDNNASRLPAQGPYYSKIVSTAPAPCPAGTPGVCISVTIDGQPGQPNPTEAEIINDAKTGKPGFAYLQDLAPGDNLCVSLSTDGYQNYHCITDVVTWNQIEQFRVLSTAPGAGSTVVLNLLRNQGSTTTLPLTPGQRLYTIPSFCEHSQGYACLLSGIAWDWKNGTIEQFAVSGGGHGFIGFDFATNQSVNVTTVADDAGTNPLCSTTSSAVYPGCYAVFAGQMNSSQSISSQLKSFFSQDVAMNPPFGVGTLSGGVTGQGTPNSVDAHPGAPQLAAASAANKTWFVDGRPFLGLSFGGYNAYATAIPNVYKIPGPSSSRQSAIEAYKRLPLMASCGYHALREVTTISKNTPYAYCVAVSAGDCMPDSSTGDSFLNCPTVNPAAKVDNACPYPGIGVYAPEIRDTCLLTAGPFTMGLTQVAFANQTNGIWSPLTQDQAGRSGRLLTHAMQRYRIVDEFWNPKTTPDGGVLLFRVPFLNGVATQVMMAPMPPFPDLTHDPVDRRAFLQTVALIDAAPDGTSSVKVQFGYDRQFRCMTRNEPCEARADFDPTGTQTPFYFASEQSDAYGWDCPNGQCPASVELPLIGQRVAYYRAVYQVNAATVFGPVHVAVQTGR